MKLHILNKGVYLFVAISIFLFISSVGAKEQGLVISTTTLVTEEGSVRIHLTLMNSGRTPLFDVQPMLHFHHTMDMMSKIVQLEPGQKVILENDILLLL